MLFKMKLMKLVGAFFDNITRERDALAKKITAQHTELFPSSNSDPTTCVPSGDVLKACPWSDMDGIHTKRWADAALEKLKSDVPFEPEDESCSNAETE